MKNKHKIILVKSVISLGAILVIVVCVLAAHLEKMPEYSLEYPFYEKLLIIFLILAALVTFVMVILMSKIDIRPEKTKSTKLRLKYNDYKIIKENLCQKFEMSGYNKLKKYDDLQEEIEYTLRKKYSTLKMVILIRIKELTEDLLYQLENQEIAKKIVEIENLNLNGNLDIIYIITVDKVTPTFSKYTEKNIKQKIWLTTLPIGISLASKTIYIATQEEGFSKLRYKRMKKQFIKDIDDMLEKTE